MRWVEGREEAPTKDRPREAQSGKQRPNNEQTLEDPDIEKRDRHKLGCRCRQRHRGNTRAGTHINSSGKFLEAPTMR